MKRTFMLLFLVALTFTPSIIFIGCYKTSSLQPNATIMAADPRQCICCGGYFISIDGEKPSSGTYFLTDGFPDNYVPTAYPLRVYIEWFRPAQSCSSNKVVINKIQNFPNLY